MDNSFLSPLRNSQGHGIHSTQGKEMSHENHPLLFVTENGHYAKLTMELSEFYSLCCGGYYLIESIDTLDSKSKKALVENCGKIEALVTNIYKNLRVIEDTEELLPGIIGRLKESIINDETRLNDMIEINSKAFRDAAIRVSREVTAAYTIFINEFNNFKKEITETFYDLENMEPMGNA
uniref:Uncharacterized protein n=1 Tax=Rhizobium phage LG08 TaxID=3129229 RepID=A0AAU8HXZ3_9CAUD